MLAVRTRLSRSREARGNTLASWPVVAKMGPNPLVSAVSHLGHGTAKMRANRHDLDARGASKTGAPAHADASRDRSLPCNFAGNRSQPVATDLAQVRGFWRRPICR